MPGNLRKCRHWYCAASTVAIAFGRLHALLAMAISGAPLGGLDKLTAPGSQEDQDTVVNNDGYNAQYPFADDGYLKKLYAYQKLYACHACAKNGEFGGTPCQFARQPCCETG